MYHRHLKCRIKPHEKPFQSLFPAYTRSRSWTGEKKAPLSRLRSVTRKGLYKQNRSSQALNERASMSLNRLAVMIRAGHSLVDDYVNSA